MLGGGECVLGLSDAGSGGVQGSRSAVELLPPLIEQFLRGIAPLHQIAGPIELLLRQRDLRPPLVLRRTRFIDRSLRLKDMSLGPLERRFEVSRVHSRDHLALAHHVAFLDPEFSHSAGELGSNVDFIGFDAAVARHDALGQSSWEFFHQ